MYRLFNNCPTSVLTAYSSVGPCQTPASLPKAIKHDSVLTIRVTVTVMRLTPLSSAAAGKPYRCIVLTGQHSIGVSVLQAESDVAEAVNVISELKRRLKEQAHQMAAHKVDAEDKAGKV